MKLDEKGKKRLAVSGGAVIGVVLLVSIMSQFVKPSQGNPASASTESTTAKEAEVTIDLVESQETEDRNEIQVTINSETVPIEAETLPAQTDLPEQALQPEVTKPAEPSAEQKTNPEQKPNGETVTETQAPVAHDAVVAPTEAATVAEEVVQTEAVTDVPVAEETTASQPQGGGTNNSGQTYFPGFGWVDGTGEGQGTTADDMYENGNKIGIMD